MRRRRVTRARRFRHAAIYIATRQSTEGGQLLRWGRTVGLATSFGRLSQQELRAATELSKLGVAVLDGGLVSNMKRLVRWFRRESPNWAILVLRSRGRSPTPESLLAAEVTDFVTRPFEPRELHARILRCLADIDGDLSQDRAPERPKLLKRGALAIDCEARMVRVRSRKIKMRRAELELLVYLVRNSPRAVSQHEILRKVLHSNGTLGSARNQIYEIRRKLERAGAGDAIQTLHGTGSYQFVYGGVPISAKN